MVENGKVRPLTRLTISAEPVSPACMVRWIPNLVAFWNASASIPSIGTSTVNVHQYTELLRYRFIIIYEMGSWKCPSYQN
jgi:hypothetical protein